MEKQAAFAGEGAGRGFSSAFAGSPGAVGGPVGGSRRAWRTRRQAEGVYARVGKRIFDVGVTLFVAPVVVPLVAVLAAGVALDGHSPFFVQRRVGKGGRSFGCLKLRSMRPDADKALDAVLATDRQAAEEWAAFQKLTNDPRVTRLGRFLRKSSLDELPQFWNVLKGDMSIVGPRPVLPVELSRYARAARDYMAVRPGLAGAWQAGGRNRVSYEQRIRLDEDYAARVSLGEDLRLMLRTAGAVFRGTGM